MNRTTKRSFSILLFALAAPLAWACGGGNDNLPPPPPPPPPPATVATTPPPPPADVDAAPPAPPPPAVTLLPGAASPDPTPAPTVHIVAPTRGQSIPADKAGDFKVKLDVKNWATAPGSAHVHLILDDKPYKPIFDTKAPIKLSDLPGGDQLAEGQHVLVAFPSRANHESVKLKGALTYVEFYVGKAKDKKVDLAKPLLVYSRPKGNYNGDMANHVLIDFQLMNETLADGKDHVHIAVTGPGVDMNSPLNAEVTKFGTPYYLDNLQNGTYSVKLDLVGGDNNPIAGAWNSVTREIKIDHDAAPSPAPMPPAPAGADADAGSATDAGAKRSK